jgi:MFS superfamily sulfate permease-like transporter
VFFGTISAVEAEIRKLLDMATWSHDPIRFLIIDLHLVHGLDFSSAEAFVRVQRILAAKDVLLIICGAKVGGVLESALRAVDLWPGLGEEGRLEVFVGLNEALEWTENAYLYVTSSKRGHADWQNCFLRESTESADYRKSCRQDYRFPKSRQAAFLTRRIVCQ